MESYRNTDKDYFQENIILNVTKDEEHDQYAYP
jgi:hypothetical protein